MEARRKEKEQDKQMVQGPSKRAGCRSLMLHFDADPARDVTTHGALDLWELVKLR